MAQKSQSKYEKLVYLLISALVLFGSIAVGTYLVNLVSPFSDVVNFVIVLIVMLGIFDTFFKPFLRKKIK